MLSHKPIKTSSNTYQSTSEWPSFTQAQSSKAAAFRTSLPWSVVRHTSFESNQHLNAPFSSIISPRRSMCLSKLPFVHPFRPSIHPSFLIPSSIIILPLSSSRSKPPPLTLDHSRPLVGSCHLHRPRTLWYFESR